MNAWIVFQRMLVLFAMMLVGFFSYKKGILEKVSYSHLSKLVVTVMNPLLIIDGVIGKNTGQSSGVLLQNLGMMLFYFTLLVVMSFPVAHLLRVDKGSRYLYRLMLIFSNVGFMGIPVITSLYGDGCVLYIAFYILGYNVLLYTYGLHLVEGNVRFAKDGADSGKKEEEGKPFWTLLINPGVLACIVAILIFALRLPVPAPAAQFVNSLGQTAVPLSMVLIGASMAQQDFRKLFADGRVYLFLLIRLLALPIAAAQLLRFLPLDRQVAGVFGLMMAMPVGSIVVLMASNRGADDALCTKGSVISTLASVVTIPIVALFLP